MLPPRATACRMPSRRHHAEYAVRNARLRAVRPPSRLASLYDMLFRHFIMRMPQDICDEDAAAEERWRGAMRDIEVMRR